MCALCRREAEGGFGPADGQGGRGGDPRAALDAWIDEILSFGHHRAKAVRVSVLSSPGAMKAEGYAEETQHATRMLMAPLERLLADGVADGSFPLADPVGDAPLIQSVAWAAAGLSPTRSAPCRGPRRRAGCARSASGRWGPDRPCVRGGMLRRPEGGLALLDPDHPVDLQDA